MIATLKYVKNGTHIGDGTSLVWKDLSDHWLWRIDHITQLSLIALQQIGSFVFLAKNNEERRSNVLSYLTSKGMADVDPVANPVRRGAMCSFLEIGNIRSDYQSPFVSIDCLASVS